MNYSKYFKAIAPLVTTGVVQKCDADGLKQAINKQDRLLKHDDGSRFNNMLRDILGWYSVPAHHFVHISTLDNTKLAFFETDLKLYKDKSTQISIGKYLTRINQISKEKGYCTRSETMIRDHAENFILNQRNIFRLVRAEGGDAIVKIYRGTKKFAGVKSCMNNESDYPRAFNNQVVRVYDHPSISIYALYAGDRLLSRAVCNNEHMCYAETYSHTGYREIMERKLSDAGYEQDSDGLYGCSIAKIEDPEGDFMVPYIDGYYCSLSDGGDVWDIAKEDEGDYFNEQTTSGYIEAIEKVYCEQCNDMEPADDSVYIESEEGYICEHCLRNNFSRVITGSNYGGGLERGYVRDDDIRTDIDGVRYSESGMEDLCTYSELYSNYIPNDRAVFSEYHDEYIDNDSDQIRYVYNIDTDQDDDPILLDEVKNDHLFIHYTDSGDPAIAVSENYPIDEYTTLETFNKRIMARSLGTHWLATKLLYKDDGGHSGIVDLLFSDNPADNINNDVLNFKTFLKHRGYINAGNLHKDAETFRKQLQRIYNRAYTQRQETIGILAGRFQRRALLDSNYNRVVVSVISR